MQGADLGAKKDDKIDASQAAKKSSKKKGGKGVKNKDAANAFSALRLEDEEDQSLDPGEDSAGGQNEGVPSAAVPKQNGSTAGQEAEQTELAAIKPKLGKKKKAKVDVGDAFAALGLDDGGKAGGDFSATNGDIACENANGHLAGTDTSQAQHKEVEHKIPSSSLNGGALDICALVITCLFHEISQHMPLIGPAAGFVPKSPVPALMDCLQTASSCKSDCFAAAGKTKQKKKSPADIDALLASMGEEPSRQDVQSDVPEADEAQAIKQTQKNKKMEARLGGDVDALLAQLGGTAPQNAEKASQPEAGELPQQADEKKTPASKADQVKMTEDVRKGAAEDFETLLAGTAQSSRSIEAELPSNDNEPAEEAAELPAPSSAADETPAGKAQRQKKKKKAKQVATVNTLISRAIDDMICICMDCMHGSHI